MIDLSKPLQTRDGRTVRDVHRLSEPLNNGDTIMGVCDGTHKSWQPDGTFSLHHTSLKTADLVNVPEEKTVWVNFYGGGRCSSVHRSERSAINMARECLENRYDAIAVKVTYPVGYGVDDE